MKKTILAIASMAILVVGIVAWGSPDHDHGAPSFQPNYGGTIQSTHDYEFEMVLKGGKILLYAYNKKGKQLKTADVKMDITLENPKTKEKKTPVKMTDSIDFWESPVDWKGSHRLTYTINVGKGKDKDYAKFTFSSK